MTPTIVAVATLPEIAFVRSPHRGAPTRSTTQAITIHATAGHEGPTKAEDCARMMLNPLLKPKRSAHYIVDSNSIVQCVLDPGVAWHCGKTGNAKTIGIELCGMTNQKHEEWFDETSLATLQLAARLIATLCSRFSLPAQYVAAADLVRGERGITTHNDVSLAWRETNHTDPGPTFPLSEFIAAVAAARASANLVA